MPHAIFDYMGAFLRNSFAHVDNAIPVIKTITWPEPTVLRQHAPELIGTLWNLANPASGTYTNTRRNSPEPSGTFRDLPEPTFRNLPEPTSWTYASIHWNPPKSSGLPPEPTHHFTPGLSGTFRNLPPEPTPLSGTFHNLLEPSGTCSCGPHRHTPELIWAEDPISLRCWGKIVYLLGFFICKRGFPFFFLISSPHFQNVG